MPVGDRSATRSRVQPSGDHARGLLPPPKGSRHVRPGTAWRPRPSALVILMPLMMVSLAEQRPAMGLRYKGHGQGQRWRIAVEGPGETGPAPP
jgi:hypothetical protein